jgi:hypothetical protein
MVLAALSAAIVGIVVSAAEATENGRNPFPNGLNAL